VAAVGTGQSGIREVSLGNAAIRLLQLSTSACGGSLEKTIEHAWSTKKQKRTTNMAMLWVLCPSCGRVGLEFESEQEEAKFRKDHPYRGGQPPLSYCSDWGGCNLCSEFVCQQCLTDFRGDIRDWCAKCDVKTDGLPPLVPGHPDPRRGLSIVSLYLLGYSEDEAQTILREGAAACIEHYGLSTEKKNQ
jgi:hypothetical protein